MRENAITVRTVAVTFSVFTLLLVPFHASAQQSRPVSRGILEAHKNDIRGEKNIPPPLRLQVKIDPQTMQRDAEELASVAQTIPTQVNQATKGLLARDLNERLKRIEKLSKKLRSQLNR